MDPPRLKCRYQYWTVHRYLYRYNLADAEHLGPGYDNHRRY